MKRLALKFGGTSVGTVEKIKKVAINRFFINFKLFVEGSANK